MADGVDDSMCNKRAQVKDANGVKFHHGSNVALWRNGGVRELGRSVDTNLALSCPMLCCAQLVMRQRLIEPLMER